MGIILSEIGYTKLVKMYNNSNFSEKTKALTKSLYTQVTETAENALPLLDFYLIDNSEDYLIDNDDSFLITP